MINRFFDYIRSSYILWIPPIYRYIREHPFVWIFSVLLHLGLRGGFDTLLYSDMLPENRTEAPELSSVIDMMHAEAQADMVARVILLLVILIWLVYNLRKHFRDPDSLARSIEMSEAERKRTVYVAGLLLDLIISAVWILPWVSLTGISDWLIVYGAGILVSILLYSMMFAFAFRGSLDQKEGDV